MGVGGKGWLFYGSDSSSVCTNQEDPPDTLELVKHAEVPASPQRYLVQDSGWQGKGECWPSVVLLQAKA